MSELLDNLWKFLFDKLGVMGMMVAAILAPIILIVSILLIVGIIKLIARLIGLLFGKRRATTRDEEDDWEEEEAPAPRKEEPVSPKPQPVQPEPEPEPEPEPPAIDMSEYDPQNMDSKTPKEVYEKAEELYEKVWLTPEVFALYLKSAEMGYFAAQGEVGRMYYYGANCTKKDEEKGLKWLKKSAEQGGVYARIVLGRIYEKKRFEDPGEVLDWLIPVAEKGNDEAQYLLSRMYSRKFEHREKTLGYVPGQWKEDELCLQWYNESKKWLKTAAENGNRDAMDLYY